MQKNLRLKFQKGDIWAILLVVLLAVAVFCAFLPGNGAPHTGTVEIYRDGALLGSYPLSREFEMEISGEYTNTLSISGGRAAITASDCPGEDCVHTGWISIPGRSIVCLPNRVEVRITDVQADVDFVVR